MKHLFDEVSYATSKLTTRTYSTSFSLGIHCLKKSIHEPIYNIYGFVRFADEIVDSFHDYDKRLLFDEFRQETYKAIDRGLSLNPVLNSFQKVVKQYKIEIELIDCFLDSMEMDLTQQFHSEDSYKNYILGSAEVVGLMCLRVFTNGDEDSYQKLKPSAMKLGSAFQKINFLRDLKDDYKTLGRIYFPNVDIARLTAKEKAEIELDIEADFRAALEGIKQLPTTSRFGVYVAYVYYYALFTKIKGIPSCKIMLERIRISNYQKVGLLARSYFKHSLRML
ncbi:MAG: phytoene/squalene synthase family protein [Sphingobacteriaceae bacterium]|nr:phytoene/squalene synthase family protein [Sphingobacteriaceae bacterium]